MAAPRPPSGRILVTRLPLDGDGRRDRACQDDDWCGWNDHLALGRDMLASGSIVGTVLWKYPARRR
jgi:hypothetical protein